MRREEGWSVKEIAQLVGVSRSSVSVWVRDVPLTDAQRETLRQRNPSHNGQCKGAAANARIARARRCEYQQYGRALARVLDPLYVAGCMLYWAEGGKSRYQARLVNSDPELLRFFAKFLRTCLNVPDHKMRVGCHLFADHESKQREIEDFWLRTVSLPRSCLNKSMVNHYSRWSQKKRKNKLRYGTCKLVVSDVRVVQAIYGGIQELAGIERPEWLDL